MAVSIEVVLRDSLSNLGHAGELVRVKPGYARNYLIPRGLAVMASKGNVHQIEHERTLAKKKAQKLEAHQSELSQKLQSIVLEISKPAGDEGRLFGSVTTKEVSDALQHHSVQLDKKQLSFKEPIRHVGEYECLVHLGGARHVGFMVRVVAK